ncbi:hypothetical protein [Xenorhabdus sp. SGI246]|uniref:hypothetical protein n=1 Tax=Xenorhabdus sp. SGI246 TaxID=3158263 RepID=UPI00349FB214
MPRMSCSTAVTIELELVKKALGRSVKQLVDLIGQLPKLFLEAIYLSVIVLFIYHMMQVDLGKHR